MRFLRLGAQSVNSPFLQPEPAFVMLAILAMLAIENDFILESGVLRKMTAH
jgi:hypothetical protein